MRKGRDARKEEQRKPSRISLPSVWQCTLTSSAVVHCSHLLLSIGRDGFSEKASLFIEKKREATGAELPKLPRCLANEA